MSLDREEQERLYTLGHSSYGAGRLHEAAEIFAVLTVHEPTEPRLWFARAATAQRRERFEEAIAGYSFAALLDPDDPWALVHLGECLLRQGARDAGRGALVRALDRAGGDGDAATRARALLQRAEGDRER